MLQIICFKNASSVPHLSHVLLRVSLIATAAELTLNFLLGESDCRVVMHFIGISHFVSLLIILTDLAFDILLVLVDPIVFHFLILVLLLFLELLVDQGL